MAYRPETYLPFQIPGFGLIVACHRADPARLPHRQLVGRTLVELGEKLLDRMPIVRPIYAA